MAGKLHQTVPATDVLAVGGKMSIDVLNQLLHSFINLLFGFSRPAARPLGIFWKGSGLQAQVLGGTLAVSSEVHSQVLHHGLDHSGKTPFISIEAQSPASGHIIRKRSHYLRP